MEDKKIWEKREVFKFIARYKHYRELWDTKSITYKNKLKRTKALHALAAEFKTNVGEINKKIRVLRSQFFCMYKKMYENKDENGLESAFVTKWEYYRPLQFILVSRENNEEFTEHSEHEQDIEKKYDHSDLEDENEKDTKVLLIVQKRRRSNESSSSLEESVNGVQKDDELQILKNNVHCNLRSMFKKKKVKKK